MKTLSDNVKSLNTTASQMQKENRNQNYEISKGLKKLENDIQKLSTGASTISVGPQQMGRMDAPHILPPQMNCGFVLSFAQIPLILH